MTTGRPHPASTDPKIVAAQSLLARIRSANASHEWRALSQDLDACNPQDLVSALALACELRSREAFNDELRRSYVRALEETE